MINHYIIFFILSGVISSAIAYSLFDEISEEHPIIESMGVEALCFTIFMLGFFAIWILLPLTIYNWYLTLKIKLLKKIEERKQTKNDRKAMGECIRLGYDLREVRKQLEETYGPHPTRYKNIEKMIEEHERNKK